MFYFAYGSMMSFDEMRKRCPSAEFFVIAKLPNHSLKFTRRSRNRGCGVADAVPEVGSNVWGIVYEITETELERLDRGEGFRSGRPLAENSYVREQRQVERNGASHHQMQVWTYLANREENPPLPNAEYKRLLVEGARYWGLPDDYQFKLAQIETA